ncbi:single-stranded DNA-binding protein [Brevibacterium sp. SIMBA_078]|uniref:single-stranded DNA-binding protein n=1 Tax=Brevibacterium sp. SIMBA_078 TaxID=3085816 RepID=UPI00397DB9D4
MAGEKKTISGNTTGDPEVRTLNDGRQIVAFTVAENKRFLDPDTQEWKDAKATFYDVAIEREHLAKHVLASVEKGQRVKVEGKVTAKPYTDRYGSAQVGHSVWATDVAASLQYEPARRGMTAPGREHVLDNGPEPAGPGRTQWGQNPTQQDVGNQAPTWGNDPAQMQQYSVPPPPPQAPETGLQR